MLVGIQFHDAVCEVIPATMSQKPRSLLNAFVAIQPLAYEAQMADLSLPQVPVVRVDYRLATGTVGWASCDLVIGSSSVTVTASYLGHALEELVEAACLAMSGEPLCEAHFWEEPGEYRWVIETAGQSTRVRIVEFDELWSNMPIEDGTVLIDEICGRTAFGAAVLRAAGEALDKHGSTGYARLWGRGEFPTESVIWLRELVLSASEPDKGAT